MFACLAGFAAQRTFTVSMTEAVNAKALQLSVSLLVVYLLFKPNPMIQKIPAKTFTNISILAA